LCNNVVKKTENEPLSTEALQKREKCAFTDSTSRSMLSEFNVSIIVGKKRERALPYLSVLPNDKTLASFFLLFQSKRSDLPSKKSTKDHNYNSLIIFNRPYILLLSNCK